MAIETKSGKDSIVLSEELLSSVKRYIRENYLEHDIDEKYPMSRMDFEIEHMVQEPDVGKTYASQAVETKARAKEKRSLDEIVGHLDETFSQALLRMIDERGLRDADVYNRANIDRRLFSKIRSDLAYRPSKHTALSLAIALRLNLDETKDLLLRAGLALSKSSKADVIVQYFIEEENFDLCEINEVLFHFGEKVL